MSNFSELNRDERTTIHISKIKSPFIRRFANERRFFQIQYKNLDTSFLNSIFVVILFMNIMTFAMLVSPKR